MRLSYVISVEMCSHLINIAMGFFFYCQQKTADEMRISDWSSDVCSSDLILDRFGVRPPGGQRQAIRPRLARELHPVDASQDLLRLLGDFGRRGDRKSVG